MSVCFHDVPGWIGLVWEEDAEIKRRDYGYDLNETMKSAQKDSFIFITRQHHHRDTAKTFPCPNAKSCHRSIDKNTPNHPITSSTASQPNLYPQAPDQPSSPHPLVRLGRVVLVAKVRAEVVWVLGRLVLGNQVRHHLLGLVKLVKVVGKRRRLLVPLEEGVALAHAVVLAKDSFKELGCVSVRYVGGMGTGGGE